LLKGDDVVHLPKKLALQGLKDFGHVMKDWWACKPNNIQTTFTTKNLRNSTFFKMGKTVKFVIAVRGKAEGKEKGA